jgi:hypothetical protein
MAMKILRGFEDYARIRELRDRAHLIVARHGAPYVMVYRAVFTPMVLDDRSGTGTYECFAGLRRQTTESNCTFHHSLPHSLLHSEIETERLQFS